MGAGKSHKDLEIWQKGIDFVGRVYEATKRFAKDEEYGLRSQMRRAAVSYPSNIAERDKKKKKKEYAKFLYVALGSLSELETQLLIAEKLGYLAAADLLDEATVLRRMTLNLIRYMKEDTGGA